MKPYYKITTSLFLLSNLLLLTGVVKRGFMLPSDWEVLEFILCLPYFLCSLFGIIVQPERSVPLTILYYILIAGNFYLLKKPSRSKSK